MEAKSPVGGVGFWGGWRAYCWWFRNPANHLGWCWNLVNNGDKRINYQSQLVSRISEPSTVVCQTPLVVIFHVSWIFLFGLSWRVDRWGCAMISILTYISGFNFIFDMFFPGEMIQFDYIILFQMSWETSTQLHTDVLKHIRFTKR